MQKSPANIAVNVSLLQLFLIRYFVARPSRKETPNNIGRNSNTKNQGGRMTVGVLNIVQMPRISPKSPIAWIILCTLHFEIISQSCPRKWHTTSKYTYCCYIHFIGALYIKLKLVNWTLDLTNVLRRNMRINLRGLWR